MIYAYLIVCINCWESWCKHDNIGAVLIKCKPENSKLIRLKASTKSNPQNKGSSQKMPISKNAHLKK